MNSLELKGLRVTKGKTQTDLAIKIEKSVDSYAKKERGEVFFTPNEIVIVVKELEMTFEQMNLIFFDMMLPFGNDERPMFHCGNIIAQKKGE